MILGMNARGEGDRCEEDEQRKLEGPGEHEKLPLDDGACPAACGTSLAHLPERCSLKWGVCCERYFAKFLEVGWIAGSRPGNDASLRFDMNEACSMCSRLLSLEHGAVGGYSDRRGAIRRTQRARD